MSIVTRIILVILGSIFIALSYFDYIESNALISDSISTIGKVVDFKKRYIRNPKGAAPAIYSYSPIVEFVSENGQKIQITSSTGSYPPNYKIGDYIEVIYQKNNPQNAMLNTFTDSWGFAIFLGVFGVILIIISFLPIKI